MAGAADTQDRSRLVADEPENFSSQPDAFGHSDYAATLAGIAARAPTPFTIGVFGPWGLGKSTIVREMARRLPEQSCVLVEFDAWRHEGHALRRHFLKDIAAKLHDAGVLRGFDPERELREVDADLSEARAFLQITAGRLLTALIPALALAVGVLLFADLVSKNDLETQAKSTPWAVASAFVAVAAFMATLASTVLGESQRTQTIKRLDEPDRFSEKFRELLAAVAPVWDGSGRRVVIAFDNLDRCSPDRVVETLGTVKTYLEPNAWGPGRAPPERWRSALRRWLHGWPPPVPADAVFVIAVDDSALRRHLLAKEFAESAVLAPGLGDQDSNERARAAKREVDEYLRKFFSVTVRVRDLLDDDMRDYTRRYLEPTVSHWLARAGVYPGEALTAVEMTTRALGRNPRRIKQFANTFEGRMSLIAQRESTDGDEPPRIEPPISTAPLLVAELMLLEEEWEHFHDKIVEDPERLARWHRFARRQMTAADLHSMQEPEAAGLSRIGTDEWGPLSAFLRVSPDPGETYLTPYLRLKQTAVERELQLLPRIRTAARTGAAHRLDEALSGLPDDLIARYLAKLRSEQARELEDGYTAASVELLSTVLRSDVLSRFPLQLGQMVAEALRWAGGQRSAVLTLDPGLILGAIHGFGGGHARMVAVALREEWSELTADERSAWASHLSWAIGSVPAPAREVIAELVAETLSTGFGQTFRPLLERAPELVPDSVVVRAAEALATRLPEDTDPPDSGSDDRVSQYAAPLWLLPVAVEAGKLDTGAAEALLVTMADNIHACQASAKVDVLLEDAVAGAAVPVSAATAARISTKLRATLPELSISGETVLLKLLKEIVKDEPIDGAWATGWAETLRSEEYHVYAAAEFVRSVDPRDPSPLVALIREVLGEALLNPGISERVTSVVRAALEELDTESAP